MRQPDSTRPGTFFFLVLPYGISNGFVSITLPFILTRAGFSVATAASVVAIGLSANLWRFFWGPVADLTLSARRWYLLGLITTAATLFLLGVMPFRQSTIGILTVIGFCFTGGGDARGLARRWFDGAYGGRGSERARGWLVSGGKSWRERCWRRGGSLAGEPFFERNREHFAFCRDPRFAGRTFFRRRCATRDDRNDWSTPATSRSRSFLDDESSDPAFHDRSRLFADRFGRHE